MVKVYRTKGIELEALQYTGEKDKDAVRKFVGGVVKTVPTAAQNVFAIMPPSSGTLYLYPGDFLMRLPNRTLKVWKEPDFQCVFERVVFVESNLEDVHA